MSPDNGTLTHIKKFVGILEGREIVETVHVLLENSEGVYFDQDVPYAKSFLFVEVGEPVVFNSSSNYISIGLNQVSFKSKYGVKAGLDWKVIITKK